MAELSDAERRQTWLRRTTTRQFRSPSGVLGAVLAAIMAGRNRALNEFVVRELDIHTQHDVLELGFGPGVGIQLASRFSRNGCVTGIDTSGVMVRVARWRNRRAVRAHRAVLRTATWDNLPFVDCSFDRIFTINTLHFWEPAGHVFAEVRRVLRPDGLFAVGCRLHGTSTEPRGATCTTGHIRTSSDIQQLFAANDFTVVRIVVGTESRDTCFLARPPVTKSSRECIAR